MKNLSTSIELDPNFNLKTLEKAIHYLHFRRNKSFWKPTRRVLFSLLVGFILTELFSRRQRS